jgi:hypothetical protein
MFAVVLRPLLPLLALVALPACSVVNNDHCANLEGDATCRERDAAAPYCSLCLPDNNGCFAEAPADACHAVTTPLVTSTGDTSAVASSSETSATTTTPIDPPTTGSGTDSASATSDTSSSTGEPDSTTTTGTTADSTTDTTTTTADTTTGTTDTTADTTTGTTADIDTDTTVGTTMSGPVCGDGMIEEDEVCDGKNLGGETCKMLLPAKWGGGTLTCNNGCKSFNDTQCCVGVGQTCGGLLTPDPKLPCCGGLTCTAEGGKHVCKS